MKLTELSPSFGCDQKASRQIAARVTEYIGYLEKGQIPPKVHGLATLKHMMHVLYEMCHFKTLLDCLNYNSLLILLRVAEHLACQLSHLPQRRRDQVQCKLLLSQFFCEMMLHNLSGRCMCISCFLLFSLKGAHLAWFSADLGQSIWAVGVDQRRAW